MRFYVKKSLRCSLWMYSLWFLWLGLTMTDRNLSNWQWHSRCILEKVNWLYLRYNFKISKKIHALVKDIKFWWLDYCLHLLYEGGFYSLPCLNVPPYLQGMFIIFNYWFVLVSVRTSWCSLLVYSDLFIFVLLNYLIWDVNHCPFPSSLPD